MKQLLTISTFILCMSVAMGQSPAEKDWMRGNAYLSIHEYHDAIKSFERIVYLKKWRMRASEKLGICYLKIREAEKACPFLEQSKKLGNKSDSLLFFLAEAKRNTGKYAEAKQHYRDIAAKGFKESYCNKMMASCDSAIAWNNKRTRDEVTNIRAINTEFSEVAPAIFHSSIVFSSNRESVLIKRKQGPEGTPYFDLYVSDCSNAPYCEKSSPFSGPINTHFHESSPSFSSHFDTLYFTRADDQNPSDNLSRLKLYSCYKHKNNQWTKPDKFILNDSTFSYAHPSIDSSGTLFFFASDMKGGYGGSDIYVCIKINEKWTKPINLGPQINTEGNEIYPFYIDEGILYFSSDTHPGFGGYDVFKAVYNNNEWSGVENLLKPINSTYDDISFIINKKNGSTGYFSSNRSGGKGSEDIYFFIKR